MANIISWIKPYQELTLESETVFCTPYGKSTKMATKKVVLSILKVADLKRELEEKDLDMYGNKLTLQKRLIEAFLAENEDLEVFLFEVPSNNFGVILSKLEEASRKLKER
ncbi:hypothetical protein FQA39_LY14002 [Lamprigera yunnana]|nr:hypothetical protein FQA39_LY14002 [Lamprigera yunnana]